jgi:hypothetical protein
VKKIRESLSHLDEEPKTIAHWNALVPRFQNLLAIETSVLDDMFDTNDALCWPPSLRKVNLVMHGLKLSNVNVVLNSLHTCASLTHLIVTYASIDLCVSWSAKTLELFPHLTKLGLSGMAIDVETARIIDTLPCLTTLIVSDVASFAKLPTTNTRVREIRYDVINSLHTIAALQHFPNLQRALLPPMDSPLQYVALAHSVPHLRTLELHHAIVSHTTAILPSFHELEALRITYDVRMNLKLETCLSSLSSLRYLDLSVLPPKSAHFLSHVPQLTALRFVFYAEQWFSLIQLHRVTTLRVLHVCADLDDTEHIRDLFSPQSLLFSHLTEARVFRLHQAYPVWPPLESDDSDDN